MSRSSATDRALVEPTAALAATVAVCAAVALYAGVLGDAVTTTERDLGEPTLTRVHDAASERGVVVPARLSRTVGAGPRGYRLNVTVSADGRRWHRGPETPTLGSAPTSGSGSPSTSADARRDDVRRASRRVSVRLGPGEVVAGRLAVVVWP